jgi:Raf kinase inhibitor-like YbhB/YbcL family protein
MLRSMLFVLLASTTLAASANEFTLRVDAADASGRIAGKYTFNGFGCSSQNLAPALHWHGLPTQTKSVALTVYDPDAPTGSGWWHWVVLNIPAASDGIPEGGDLPTGARGIRNDFGTKTWGGPCPPAGDKPHHYVFTVYALDVPAIDLPDDASAALAGFALHSHVIGKAQKTLTYGR